MPKCEVCGSAIDTANDYAALADSFKKILHQKHCLRASGVPALSEDCPPCSLHSLPEETGDYGTIASFLRKRVFGKGMKAIHPQRALDILWKWINTKRTYPDERTNPLRDLPLSTWIYIPGEDGKPTVHLRGTASSLGAKIIREPRYSGRVRKYGRGTIKLYTNQGIFYYTPGGIYIPISPMQSGIAPPGICRAKDLT